MYAVRVSVESEGAYVEYLVHVRNRSKFALLGANRSARRRYPNARSITVEYTSHKCPACSASHPTIPALRPRLKPRKD